MGQDQSTSGNGGDSAAQTSSLQSFLAKGISPRPSRIPKQVVVVRSGLENSQSMAIDEDIVKLQEIPFFYPILRNSLNIPDVKDPPDLYSKFDYKATHALFQRLQEHLATTSEIVANEQGSLGTRIREIDYAVATMSNYLTEKDKTLTRMTGELVKIKDINMQMSKISAVLQEIVPMTNELTATLNSLLPPDEDPLPPLSFTYIFKSDGDRFVPLGTEEQRVVDKQ